MLNWVLSGVLVVLCGWWLMRGWFGLLTECELGDEELLVCGTEACGLDHACRVSCDEASQSHRTGLDDIECGDD